MAGRRDELMLAAFAVIRGARAADRSNRNRSPFRVTPVTQACLRY